MATALRSTRVVLDASAFIRGVDSEARDERARLWLEAIADARLGASGPDVFLLEVANTLATFVRAGRFDRDAAEDALGLALSLGLGVASARELAFEVLAAVLDTGLSAYDASYLVVAEQSDAVLVTADRRLAAACPRSALLPDVGPEDVFGLPGQGD